MMDLIVSKGPFSVLEKRGELITHESQRLNRNRVSGEEFSHPLLKQTLVFQTFLK